MTTSIDAATTLSTTADALAFDILRGATRVLGSPQSNVIPQSTIHLPGPGPWDLSDFDDNYNIFVPWGINTTIYALGGNDTLGIYNGASTVYGGAGNDHITTSVNGAVFDGEDDDDTLIATGGDAMLIGGKGNDTLRATNYSDGLNWLSGGDGNDELMTFGVGNSYLDGGDGNDRLYAGDDGSASILLGGAGNDRFLSAIRHGLCGWRRRTF
jgi:Ca2+-binding RTX toxin-like protein